LKYIFERPKIVPIKGRRQEESRFRKQCQLSSAVGLAVMERECP
jgi:hypothetical protein